MLVKQNSLDEGFSDLGGAGVSGVCRLFHRILLDRYSAAVFDRVSAVGTWGYFFFFVVEYSSLFCVMS